MKRTRHFPPLRKKQQNKKQRSSGNRSFFETQMGKRTGLQNKKSY